MADTNPEPSQPQSSRDQTEEIRAFLAKFVGGGFALTLALLALAPVFLTDVDEGRMDFLKSHFKDVAAVTSGVLGLMIGHYFTKK